MSVFSIKKCRKKYKDIAVLHDISFDVNEGEVVAIIGSSGSGKTTLLRICTELEKMDDGEMSYMDRKFVVSEGGKALYNGVNPNEYFGLVFQNFNLFPHWTVLKNVMDAPVSVKKIKKEDAKEKALFYLEKMGLKDKKDSYPCELSGGQQQRVAIARALCMEPKIIFFDEPTSALDPELTAEVLKVIKDLAKEKRTMVIVTHEMNFARDVADRVIFMDKGYIVEEGNAYDLITNPKKERTRKFLQKLDE